jgi:CHAD domain-containing protein
MASEQSVSDSAARRHCFEAVDVRPVRGWLVRHAAEAGLSLKAAAPEESRRLYFDTEDGRFRRAGLSLSVCQTGDRFRGELGPSEQATRGPVQQAMLVDDRPETLLGCQGQLGRRVRLLAGRQDLAKQMEVTRRSEVFTLSGEGGAPVSVELVEFEVPVDDSGVPVRLGRVSIEGTGERLAALERAIMESCGLRLAATSSYQSILAATGLAAADQAELGPTAVDPSQNVGEAAFAVLRKHFRRWQRHDPGTRLGEDPEALHDLRVAIRRMRAALRLYAEFLPAPVRRLDDPLRWVARATGDARDLDVQLEQLAHWRETLQGEDPAALDALEKLLHERRSRARRRMLAVMDSARYQRLVDRIGALLRKGPGPRARLGRQSVLAAAPALIAGRYRRVVKLGKQLDEGAPVERYHRLRIRCKQLRYAVEFHAGLYGDEAQRLIRALVALQDLLGEHQDAVVALNRLRAAVDVDSLSPRAVFVVGRLAERYAAQAARLRREFTGAFAHIRGKRWKRLRELMASLAAPDAGNEI